MLLPFLASFVIPGGLLLILGLRGKRIDRHPRCRKCGYDLVGKLNEVQGSRIPCPECGETTIPVIGNRIRRPRFIQTGTLMLLVGILPALFLSYAFVAPDNLQQMKPMWWLFREAQSQATTTRTAAQEEILRRVINNEIDESETDLLRDHVFDVMRTVDEPLEQWNEVAHELAMADHFTPDELNTYFELMFADPVLLTQRRLHVGKTPVFEFQMQWRGPSDRQRSETYMFDSVISGLRINSVTYGEPYTIKKQWNWPIDPFNSTKSHGVYATSAVFVDDAKDPKILIPELPVGVHECELDIELYYSRDLIKEAYGSAQPDVGFEQPNGMPETRMLKVSATFEIIPEDQPAVTWVEDRFAEDLWKSLSATYSWSGILLMVRIFQPGPYVMDPHFDFHFAFDVMLETDTGLLMLGTFNDARIPTNMREFSGICDDDDEYPFPGTIAGLTPDCELRRLHLIPSTEVAEQVLGQDRFWTGDPIVLDLVDSKTYAASTDPNMVRELVDEDDPRAPIKRRD